MKVEIQFGVVVGAEMSEGLVSRVNYGHEQEWGWDVSVPAVMIIRYKATWRKRKQRHEEAFE